MARSPELNAGRPVSLYLKAAGVDLSDLSILDVEVDREVDRIPRARLVVRDGDPAKGAFPASARPELAPGSTLTISAGYVGVPAVARLFEGIVVRHGLEIEAGSSRLIIEAADKAIRLTTGKAGRVGVGASVATSLKDAFKAADVSAADLSLLETPQESVVQTTSDWDFLLASARSVGAMVVVDDGKISVLKPTLSGSAAVTVTYGDALKRLDIRADATQQLVAAKAQARAWSYADQTMSEASAAAPTLEAVPGSGFSADTLEAVVGRASQALRTSATLTATGLQAAADAAYVRAHLTRLQGSVEFQGDAAARPGGLLQLSGIGTSLSGPAWMRGVRHRLSAARWTTTALLGLEAPRTPEPAQPGSLAPLRGLQVGKVQKVTGDPSGQHRVFVNLPSIKDKAKEAGVWARLAQPYASNGFGLIAFPEVDDEVVLAFMDEDSRSAIILAGLYSSGRPPPRVADAENTQKALVTRSKIELSFDDKDVVVTLQTPGGRSVTLDDKAHRLEVKDKAGSRVTLDDDGLHLHSPKDMEISADGAVTFTAKKDITIRSDAASTFKGGDVTITGTKSLTAESQGPGKLKATGELIVSGAMVKIN